MALLQPPLKPKDVVPLGVSAPFQDRFVTVTAEPLVVCVPPHSCVMVWPLGKVQTTVQPVSATVPVFRTSTEAPKPVGHWLTTV